jgi:hypothetical protein
MEVMEKWGMRNSEFGLRNKKELENYQKSSIRNVIKSLRISTM